MTKLDPTAEAHLKVFEAAYAVYKTAESDLESVLRAELEKQLIGLRIDASKAANRAVVAGVPVTRLGDPTRKGMRTKNYNTIRAFLDLTKDMVTVTAEELYVDPLDSRYSLDLANEPWPLLTVTLEGDVLDHQLTLRGWTDRRLVKQLGLDHAVFEVPRFDDGSLGLNPLSAIAYEEHNWNLQPVVAWISNNRDNRAEAVAWCTAHIDQTTD